MGHLVPNLRPKSGPSCISMSQTIQKAAVSTNQMQKAATHDSGMRQVLTEALRHRGQIQEQSCNYYIEVRESSPTYGRDLYTFFFFFRPALHQSSRFRIRRIFRSEIQTFLRIPVLSFHIS